MLASSTPFRYGQTRLFMVSCLTRPLLGPRVAPVLVENAHLAETRQGCVRLPPSESRLGRILLCLPAIVVVQITQHWARRDLFNQPQILSWNRSQSSNALLPYCASCTLLYRKPPQTASQPGGRSSRIRPHFLLCVVTHLWYNPPRHHQEVHSLGQTQS
jgi:hypothetical protein